jgi:hypothetical protein
LAIAAQVEAALANAKRNEAEPTPVCRKIGSMAAIQEKRIFRRIDIFTSAKESRMSPTDVLSLISSARVADHESAATRRALLLASLFAALPLAGSSKAVLASPLDPSETAITLPDAIRFEPWSGAPPHSGAMATLYGGLDTPGPYLVLMKWYPGYMSAPHFYATDRLSMVLSGTWWVNSGADFDPDRTVPVRAGGFVRRVARTPHYDGVKRDAKEPAVIALFGIAPVDLTLVDPGKPGWRQV